MAATWPLIVLTSAGVTKGCGKLYGRHDIRNYVKDTVNQVEGVEMHSKKDVKLNEKSRGRLKSKSHCFVLLRGHIISSMRVWV
jgi:hypothetical protein